MHKPEIKLHCTLHKLDTEGLSVAELRDSLFTHLVTDGCELEPVSLDRMIPYCQVSVSESVAVLQVRLIQKALDGPERLSATVAKKLLRSLGVAYEPGVSLRRLKGKLGEFARHFCVRLFALLLPHFLHLAC